MVKTPVLAAEESHNESILPVQVDEEEGKPHERNEEPESPAVQRVQVVLRLRPLWCWGSSKPSTLAPLLLAVFNVVCWYLTNAFNGISMQTFVSRYNQQEQQSLLPSIAIMATVTGIQLGLGGVTGMLSLFCLSRLTLRSPTTATRIPFFRSIVANISKEELISACLHGTGSLCTNLGFAFGSASQIQLLKLLEPFETLLLSQLLVPSDAACTTGILASMAVVVGAAVSLVRIRPKKPNPYSILFSVLSGLTLSSRNVLQRRQHLKQQHHPHAFIHEEQQLLQQSCPWTKVDRSIRQFTKLSLYSAFMTACLGLLLLPSQYEQVLGAINVLEWQVLTWHPLYNIFSMITLGFCSAPSHSLLNAGKRVLAILMAILWFGEGLNQSTVMGLLTVAGGGMWYSVETRRRQQGRWAWIKFVVAAAVLNALVAIQRNGSTI